MKPVMLDLAFRSGSSERPFCDAVWIGGKFNKKCNMAHWMNLGQMLKANAKKFPAKTAIKPCRKRNLSFAIMA
jgi:hypothetical protein